MNVTNSVRRISLLCVLALCACATPAPPRLVEVSPPRLAPAPADVMVERPANFRARLLSFFSASPPTPTPSPTSSPPVSGL